MLLPLFVLACGTLSLLKVSCAECKTGREEGVNGGMPRFTGNCSAYG